MLAPSPSAEHEPPARVTHYGPDPSSIGGMASVIATMVAHQLGAQAVDYQVTWKPFARLASLGPACSSMRAILRSDASRIAHFHLSERGSFVREGALIALARMRGLPVVATIHGAFFVRFATEHPRVVGAVLARADVVTCLDEGSRRAVRACAPHTHAELVPNPIDVDVDSPPADETDEIVLFAGEIGLRKGADVLCEAWPRVAALRERACCLLVGPRGDYTPLPLERLRLRDPLPREQLRELMRQARVVALPSRAEGVPMTLSEALAAGRPFVSTPVGGIAELARDSGVLVEVDDAEALADALVELLGSPTLARTLGEHGRERCAQTMSLRAVDYRLREVYARALDRHAR